MFEAIKQCVLEKIKLYGEKAVGEEVVWGRQQHFPPQEAGWGLARPPAAQRHWNVKEPAEFLKRPFTTFLSLSTWHIILTQSFPFYCDRSRDHTEMVGRPWDTDAASAPSNVTRAWPAEMTRRKKWECYRILLDPGERLFVWDLKRFCLTLTKYHLIVLFSRLCLRGNTIGISSSSSCTWTHMVPSTCLRSSPKRVCDRFYSAPCIVPHYPACFTRLFNPPAITTKDSLFSFTPKVCTTWHFSLTVPPSPTIPFDNRQTEPLWEIISAKMLFTEVSSLRNGAGLVQCLNLLFFTSMTWRHLRFWGCSLTGAKQN